MSTRALIGEKTRDKFRYIYSHSDGYPEYVGKMLKEYYINPEKIKALLNLGDISLLDKEIGEKQDFNNRHRGWTLAYHRDRGEKNTEAKETKANKIYMGTAAE
jgi:hypothetical protein